MGMLQPVTTVRCTRVPRNQSWSGLGVFGRGYPRALLLYPAGGALVPRPGTVQWRALLLPVAKGGPMCFPCHSVETLKLLGSHCEPLVQPHGSNAMWSTAQSCSMVKIQRGGHQPQT